MAAYAALVSLINTMDQIKNHPRLSFAFDNKQIESLDEKLGFLLDFIEANSSGRKAEAVLETQITSAAYEAEDVIESHVVDQVHAGSIISMLDLQTLIEEMDCIKENVNKFKHGNACLMHARITAHDNKSDCELIQLEQLEEEVKGKVRSNDVQPIKHSLMGSTSLRLPKSTTNTTTMIGFDDQLIQLMEMLVGWESSRKIIPVHGMGGIGKTTLARNTYENPTIVNHFHIQAWVTVSQTYTAKSILSEILDSSQGKSCDYTDAEDYQLGEKLHKILSGRRYLIVLDDVWSVDAWERIMFFFPDNNNRSRIVVTTRLSNMATHFGSSFLSMNLLDEDKSWNLFREKAFAQQGGVPPPKLEKIGKEIAKKCKGLPLSITVIGGLLGKSSKTKEYWENVAEDINSVMNSGEDEHCLNILSLSYTHLPAHLKPCFLYMGVFPEDHEILVPRLIKLWVAEGFLKPNETQSPEVIATSYLIGLVERNLILALKWGVTGKLKACSIHDLTRDMCLRIAEKESFLHVTNSFNNIQGEMTRYRRLVVLDACSPEDIEAMQSESLARSLFFESVRKMCYNSRFLRVLSNVDVYNSESLFEQVNLRYLSIRRIPPKELSSSISLLWNLQTFVGSFGIFFAPLEIWEMPQLRHLEFGGMHLPYPPSGQQHGSVLRNLQTLEIVIDMRLSEEMCQRIPNVRQMSLTYSREYQGGYYCLGNLGRFDKLESLSLSFRRAPNEDHLFRLQNLKLPSSLQKLTLAGHLLRWEDLALVAYLPNLQVLKLRYHHSAVGSEWHPIEGQFLGLKSLGIKCRRGLTSWNAESFHFPVLEKLHLHDLSELEEVPSGIGEIPTLGVIHLTLCSESSAISALKILEEQESQGNDGIRVRIELWNEAEMESFKERVEPQSKHVKLCVFMEDFHLFDT